MELDTSELKIEEIWGSSMIDNQLKFYVKWKYVSKIKNFFTSTFFY